VTFEFDAPAPLATVMVMRRDGGRGSIVMRGVRDWVGRRRACSDATTWGFRIRRHVGRQLFAAVTHASFHYRGRESSNSGLLLFR
jgi:hypothetical protein